MRKTRDFLVFSVGMGPGRTLREPPGTPENPVQANLNSYGVRASLATARAAGDSWWPGGVYAPGTHSPVANIKTLLGFDSPAPRIVSGQVAGQVDIYHRNEFLL